MLLLAAWLAAAPAWADESQLRRYVLPNKDTLELMLPAGWADHFEQPAGGGPPTVEIAVSDGGPRQVFVRPEWADPTAKDVRELPQLRDAVRDLAERIQPDAVETYLEVRHIAGVNGVGFYFTATDRSPGPGELKFMSQGALQADALVHDPDGRGPGHGGGRGARNAAGRRAPAHWPRPALTPWPGRGVNC
jgi:hypothetical protein